MAAGVCERVGESGAIAHLRRPSSPLAYEGSTRRQASEALGARPPGSHAEPSVNHASQYRRSAICRFSGTPSVISLAGSATIDEVVHGRRLSSESARSHENTLVGA